MGKWQGDDYREVPTDLGELDIDSKGEFNTVQRRAYIYEQVQEAGHPSLLNKNDLAEELDISRRQVYYDMEAVSEFVEDIAGQNHVGENYTIFERAKREALARGDHEMAIAVLKDEAEWLENRGAIDKEPEEMNVSWRKFIEEGDE